MKEQIAKLFKLKSIVTLLVTISFCVLSLAGVIPHEEFLKILTIIIVFYFAKNGGVSE